MKKFTIILSAFLLCFLNVWSQKIKYEKSFEEAQKISMEQNKPLCILITFPPPPYVTDYLGAFKDPQVATKFNENFINYTIERSDTASNKIIKLYNIRAFPAFIFLDSKGGLILSRFGAMPPPKLLSMADMVLSESKERSLTDFDTEYKSGNYNKAFLKQYITKRMKAGITNNSDLIEKYVDSLAVADLNNYGEVLFILKSGPLADGKAFKLAHTNRKIIDSIFKHELFDVRKTINDRIINNTMSSAIALKSYQRAIAAANFTRTSWGKDFRQGQKNHSSKMMYYSHAIKDTLNYLKQAMSYYDHYYMNISADSVRRLDNASQEKAQSNANEQAALNMPVGGSIQSVAYAFAVNTFATELNNGAYTVYKTGTKNNTYLTKAMLWSKRSIELNPSPAYYDTLSHLLYRLGFYAEAESTQQKAFELAKAENRNVKQIQEELVKIKNKTL